MDNDIQRFNKAAPRQQEMEMDEGILLKALRDILNGTSPTEREERDPKWLLEQVHIRARGALIEIGALHVPA